MIYKDLPYPEDPLSTYRGLHHLPGFALLQSIDQTRGRYDILAAYPYDSLIIPRDTPQVELREQLQKINSPCRESTIDLPFQGGMIGFVSYDLGALLYDIEAPEQQALAQQPLLHLNYYGWGIVVDHEKKTASLIALEDDNPGEGMLDEIIDLWLRPSQANQTYNLTQKVKPGLAYEQYAASFNAIHQAIQRGRCYQVNFTQSFVAKFTGSPYAIYETIARTNPVPFASYLNFSPEVILSFSPERFLLAEQGRLSVAPIKGTIKRAFCPEEDKALQEALRHSSKNQAENVMIVDLMRNDLGQLAKPGTVKVTSLFEVQSFKAVHHLVSEIEAQCLPGVTPLEAFFACFPSGSITGAPKKEAMRLIQEQEHFGRGVYCGSILYYSSHGRLDSNVAIRTLSARSNHLHLAAGGGLVIDSELNEEYCESLVKLEAILNAIE